MSIKRPELQTTCACRKKKGIEKSLVVNMWAFTVFVRLASFEISKRMIRCLHGTVFLKYCSYCNKYNTALPVSLSINGWALWLSERADGLFTAHTRKTVSCFGQRSNVKFTFAERVTAENEIHLGPEMLCNLICYIPPWAQLLYDLY